MNWAQLAAAAGTAWGLLGELAPYLLFGFLVAGVLSELITPASVERHLAGRGWWQVVKASLFGVPLPLCSCSVIPVAVALRAKGASVPATVSFLVSTPQTGVDSIMVTHALLGPVIAFFRPLVALATGVIAGLVTAAADGGGAGDARPGVVPTTIPVDPANGGERGAGTGGGRRWLRMLRYGYVTLPADIAGSMLLGIALTGIIAIVIPDQGWLREYGSGWLARLAMLAVAVPTYVCATGSVPLAAGLITKGVSPGAALVYLMAGPATSAATISTMVRTLGVRVTTIYVGSIALGALSFGAALDVLMPGLAATLPAATLCHADHAVAMPWWQSAFAVILLVVLLAPVGQRVMRWSGRYGRPAPSVSGEGGPMAGDLAGCGCSAGDGGLERRGGAALIIHRLRITGMTCDHCAGMVEDALRAVSGVVACRVELAAGRAIVEGGAVADLHEAVTGLGYRIEPCQVVERDGADCGCAGT